VEFSSQLCVSPHINAPSDGPNRGGWLTRRSPPVGCTETRNGELILDTLRDNQFTMNIGYNLGALHEHARQKQANKRQHTPL
jgi:hypothetical protein